MSNTDDSNNAKTSSENALWIVLASGDSKWELNDAMTNLSKNDNVAGRNSWNGILLPPEPHFGPLARAALLGILERREAQSPTQDPE